MEKRQLNSRERKPVSELASSKFDDQIKQKEQALQDAIDQKESAVNIRVKKHDLEIARREKEIFIWEKDTTGALKGERFGKDLAGLIQSCGLERGADGKANFTKPEAAAKTQMLQVNMGELDRLNTSGDHALGDKGLEFTFFHIQNRVNETLRRAFPDTSVSKQELASKYDIYRLAGNDFIVILKDMDQEAAQEVGSRLTERLDISEIAPNEEPVPLAANTMSFAEGLDLLNKLPKPDEKLEKDDMTLLIDLFKNKMQTVSDFQKIRTRCTRLAEKMKAQEGQPDEDKAREFYRKFYKETIGKAFLEKGEEKPMEYDRLKELFTNFGAFKAESVDWQAKIFNTASQEAVRLCSSRNMVESEKSKIILEKFLEDLKQRAAEEKLSGLEVLSAESSGVGFKDWKKEDDEIQKEFEERLSYFSETEGRQELQLLADRVNELKKNKAPQNQIHLAELDLELLKAKRDTATGLYGRGMFFQNLNGRMKENKPVSVVSVDLSLIKFFDKEGGTKTGNQAIRGAGLIMEHVKNQIKEKYGINIEAYRVGGDEFSFTIDSADKKVMDDILSEIKQGSDRLGNIATYPGATERYKPEGLRFNFGTHSIESAAAFRKELEASGYPLQSQPGSSEEQNELSDTLVRISDQEIEFEKASDRMTMLLGRMILAERAEPEDKKALEQNIAILSSYSEKAIFGSLGRDKLKEWFEKIKTQGTLSRDLIRNEIIPFIIEQLQEKGKKQEEFDQETLEEIIESAYLTFANIRIQGLEKEFAGMQKKLGAEHANVIELKKKLEEARQEVQAVGRLRSRIAEG